MSARKLVLFAALAAALLLLALWLAGERRPSQDAALSQPLAPALIEQLDDIERVRISVAGDQPVATLERTEDGWQLLERDRYPADAARLRELLLKLAEARRIEAKTANPALHDRLGVEDIDTADAAGVQVAIEGGPLTQPLIIGYTRTQGTGTYVRGAGDPQSWLIDRNIAVERKTANWLQRDLVDLDTARLERVEIRPPSGSPIRIERSAGSAGDFRLAGLPAGREPASEFVADASAGLLSSLRIDDVRRADALDEDPATLREATFLTREGVRIDLRSWQVEGATWGRFEAVFDQAQADAWIAAEQALDRDSWERRQAALEESTDDLGAGADGSADTDAADADPAVDGAEPGEELAPLVPLAVSDPEADRQQRIELARDEVEALNRRFAGWVFVLPNFKAANLNRDLDAYLRPKD
jgi:hypothetical protein